MEKSGTFGMWALSFSALILLSEAVVIITKDNNSLVFESLDASFTPKVPSTGICGILFSGNPFNACAPLSNAYDTYTCPRFVLVSRGYCSFDTKVRRAQDAGFAAVLVADNMENTELVTMAGNKRGVSIPAVFISKVAGDMLSQYTNDSYVECCILPAYENIAWIVMVISFISLISITAVFAICFLIRQQRSHHMQSRRLKESNGISYQAVKSMPSAIYQSKMDDSEFYDTCAICLEDYVDGAKLRILPCNHRFHCSCIDAWLINWRAFCPVCKQNVVKAIMPPTECTPLLRSNNPEQLFNLPPREPLQAVGPQEDCGNSIQSEARSPPQLAQPSQFSFDPTSSRSNGTPIGISRASRHMSLICLNCRGSRQRGLNCDSVEAFRASPYFTPPSFLHSSAPNVLSPLGSSSSDSHLIGLNCGSLPGSCSGDSPLNAGESRLI